MIDDEPALGRSIGRALGVEHEVVVQVSARDALEGIISGDRYDAIVCDLMMPEMSGMEFYDALRGEAGDLAERVLFITGGAFSRASQMFVQTTQRPVLPKPFAAEELLDVVRSLTSRDPRR